MVESGGVRRSVSELVLGFCVAGLLSVLNSGLALKHMHHGGSKLYGRQEVCVSVFL